MKIDHANRRVYVRQSSLNDMLICHERTRLRAVFPDMSGPSDATAMGTAVHAAIEATLNGTERDTANAVALDEFHKLRHLGFKETNLDADKYETHINSMFNAFYECVLPEVKLGGETEWGFLKEFGLQVDGYDVFLQGTVDYVDPDGVIWDWKTAGRLYNAKDKQATSIQASVYAYAAFMDNKTTIPADFRYGIMVRQETPKAQIVYLNRDWSHIKWLRSVVEPNVRYAIRTGYDNPWLRNDTSNLCSSKWCDHWTLCKGKDLSDSDFALPSMPVTLGVDSKVTRSAKVTDKPNDQ